MGLLKKVPSLYAQLISSYPSKLDGRIEQGIIAFEKGPEAALADIRKDLAEACPSYVPEEEAPAIMCISGSGGKRPFRGKDCQRCVVGQLSANGLFTGENQSSSFVQVPRSAEADGKRPLGGAQS